ncbi:MAG: EamA family transporter [Sandaracinus sp.]|nr:EamA family transporter [Myxococcales bacterium]MCB9612845.1 EamA family transporter [Sandaracinus sp.]
MTPLAALLVLASALAHATWNAMLKGRRGDPLAASGALCLGWVVAALPMLAVVESPLAASWPHMAASTVLHLVYFYALVAAYRVADLSLVYPIARGLPPLLVALGAVLVLRERLSLVGWGGVALVTAGVLAIGLTRGAGHGRGLGLALLTACLIGGYTLVDGAGARASGSPLGYASWLFVIQGSLFAASAYAIAKPDVRSEMRARWRSGLLAGTLAAAGYAIALWAMTVAPVAHVAALRETSVVFAAAIGAVFLKEPLGRRRLVAAAAVAAGVVAIQLGG